MSRDHDDFTHVLEAWLDTCEDAEDPGTVLDRVVARIEVTPQRRAYWPTRRFSEMNVFSRIALAAAAVVITAIVGLNLMSESQWSVGGPGPTDATPTAAETRGASSPQCVVEGDRLLAPGRQVIDDVTPFRISFIPPEGPESWWGISQAPTGWLAFSYLGDCPGKQVEGWSVIGFTSREAPACAFFDSGFGYPDLAEVTIDGFAGLRNDEAGWGWRGCHPNQVLDALSAPLGRGPTNLLTVYALDVGGEELVIYVWSDRGGSKRQEVLEQVAESVQIERP